MLLTAAELDRVVRSIRLVVFDFDGVFTDNTVFVSQDGTEFVRCWRGDGLGLKKLAALGIQSRIVSTETNPVVSMRAAKLKIECLQSVSDKRAAVLALGATLGIAPEYMAFVGNDINDLECMATVGLAIGVADAHPDIAHCIRYRTAAAGGRGAVREICDLFQRIHDQ
jgi:3-deoxy-D-manno-octulosonate 8-phosphate phosphatase (KDO 8-P phosphatase)